MARLPTIRRHKSQSLHSPAGKPPAVVMRGRSIQRTMAEMNVSAENLGENNKTNRISNVRDLNIYSDSNQMSTHLLQK